MELWNLIIQSNAFNFIVLVVVLGLLMKKMNVSAQLENLREKIADRITFSQEEREKAKKELEIAQNSVANLENEIDEQKQLAQKNVEGAVKQTLQNAEQQSEKILNNIQTVIENEEKQISSRIINDTTERAVEAAKNKIIEKLNANPQLHDKYINEAIEDIDKVTL